MGRRAEEPHDLEVSNNSHQPQSAEPRCEMNHGIGGGGAASGVQVFMMGDGWAGRGAQLAS